VKVNPLNQTLILASERRGQSEKSGTTLDQAFSAASSGGVLKRVTIVAAQPDSSLLYLRADYASSDDSHPATATLSAKAGAPSAGGGGTSQSLVPSSSRSLVSSAPSAGLRDAYGNSAKSRDVGLSSYLKPVEQYAQTQRILSPASAATHIDVRV
jgi:hypothetical protein